MVADHTGTTPLLEIQPVDVVSAVELLTVGEAAKLLCISPSGVRRLQHARRISFFRVGASIRFAKEDLLRYLAKRRTTSTGA